MDYLLISKNKGLGGMLDLSAGGFSGVLVEPSSEHLFNAWLQSAQETVAECFTDASLVKVDALRFSANTGYMYAHCRTIGNGLGLENDEGYFFLPSLVLPDNIALECGNSVLARLLVAWYSKPIPSRYWLSEEKMKVVKATFDEVHLLE